MLLVESGESSLFDIIEEVREEGLDPDDDFKYTSIKHTYELRLWQELAMFYFSAVPLDKILTVIKSVASALDYLVGKN